jgi:hypothetical protein
MCQRGIGLPTAYDLTYEDSAARDVAAQRHMDGLRRHLAARPVPQYGDAIQATVYWLRGEAAVPSAGRRGRSPVWHL